MKYSYKIFWSEEDCEYVAQCVELPGLTALSDNAAEALQHCQNVVTAYLEIVSENTNNRINK